jgi:hypothetical protein
LITRQQIMGCQTRTGLAQIDKLKPKENRRVDCRGPAALAMTGREIRHCEARSAVAIHAAEPSPEALEQSEPPYGLPRAFGPRNDGAGNSSLRGA